MTIFTEKIKEVVSSVLPVSLIVLLLQFIFTPMTALQTGYFIVGTVMIILGLAIFLLGVDISISPIGLSLGKGLVKTNKMVLVLGGGFLLGFLISIAEPDLLIFAENVDHTTNGAIGQILLVAVVSIGVALMISLGFFRQLKRIPLKWTFFLTYIVIGLLAAFTPPLYMSIAFDASGATTGAITVPFVLALSLGVASIHHRSSDNESEGFGLVGMASAGAIITVLILGITAGQGEMTPVSETTLQEGHLFEPFLKELLPKCKEALMSIGPLAVIFYAFNAKAKDIRGRQLRRVSLGLIYSYVGLVIFLAGVNSGFMQTGKLMGEVVAALNNRPLLYAVGFFLGMTTILAEPAVHVLTRQIEEETQGHLNSKLVLAFLAVGVAISGLLAMIKITVPDMQLWYILLPGYIVAATMLFFTPELFIGIAFDSGGVASGPMTATFILSFTQGVANQTPTSDALLDGFGVIALVAMMPLIALQLLGLIYKIKLKREAEVAKGGPTA